VIAFTDRATATADQPGVVEGRRPSPRRPHVGIVGGGQLARMTAQAAVPLGIEVTVLDPDPAAPASGAGARVRVGDPARLEHLVALARSVDVVTFDHELVPIDHVRALEEQGFVVAPGAGVAELAFDKSVARRRLAEAGFPVPRAVVATSPAEVVAAGARLGWPVVVKAVRGGYDGRGVAMVAGPTEARTAAELLGPEVVVEEHVDFDGELAVMVARSRSGQIVCYPPVTTVQADGMCAEVVAPAAVSPRTEADARELAAGLADAFGLVGVMAVELFAVGERLVVNEVATRPHNTAHLTIEAAETSQFAQHLRAVLDWPLGATALRAPAAAMCNVVGPADGSDPADRLARALEVPGAHVHLYGKAARPGRKLGHVTALGATPEAALATARAAAARLS